MVLTLEQANMVKVHDVKEFMEQRVKERGVHCQVINGQNNSWSLT